MQIKTALRFHPTQIKTVKITDPLSKTMTGMDVKEKCVFPRVVEQTGAVLWNSEQRFLKNRETGQPQDP